MKECAPFGAHSYFCAAAQKAAHPPQRDASRLDVRIISPRSPSGGLLSACTESRQRCIQGGLWASPLKIPRPVRSQSRGAGTASTVRWSCVAGARLSGPCAVRGCGRWLHPRHSAAASLPQSACADSSLVRGSLFVWCTPHSAKMPPHSAAGCAGACVISPATAGFRRR